VSEDLKKEFEKEFSKLSEKDKREVNNLIRFMQEKKYHDNQYEELLNQYIELSRDYENLYSILKEVREKLEYLLTHNKVEINGTIYLKQEADDYITNYILEILDKENK
jgi:predicted RNase H-like nuclease (RuvC/YqgF family)